MKKILLSISFFTGSTLLVSAQAGQVNGRPLIDLLNLAQVIVNRLSPIAVTVALLAFFWFLIQFIWKASESAEAKNMSVKGMWYSILALFVMVSIWGIIAFLQNLFGVPPLTQPDVPLLPPGMRNN